MCIDSAGVAINQRMNNSCLKLIYVTSINVVKQSERSQINYFNIVNSFFAMVSIISWG